MSTFKSYQYRAEVRDSDPTILDVVSRYVQDAKWPNYIVHDLNLYLFDRQAKQEALSHWGSDGAVYTMAKESHPLYVESVKELADLYKKRVSALQAMESDWPKIHDDFVAEFLQHTSPGEYELDAVNAFFDGRDLDEQMLGYYSGGSRRYSISEQLFQTSYYWRRSSPKWECVANIDTGSYTAQSFKAMLQDLINSIPDSEGDDVSYRFEYCSDESGVYVEREHTVQNEAPNVQYVFDTARKNANKCMSDMRQVWVNIMNAQNSESQINKFLGSFE